MRIVPNGFSRDHSDDGNNDLAPRRVLVLGSTGSIGRSTLEILRSHREEFELFGIVAGANASLLSEQVREFRPRFAGLADAGAAKVLDQVLGSSSRAGTEVVCGQEMIQQLCAHPDVDVVVCGVVGMAALPFVIAAIEGEKHIALANKECLVAGGKWVVEALERSPKAQIIPVDSEHSALFQALQGEDYSQVARLVLTASGGPFLNTPVSELAKMSPAQAVAHPRWSMGRKISVDSATMMNKALEVIEAHWLYDLSADHIDVLIHPQSIVHSLVRFVDGSEIAQLSVPDMKGAIAFALNFPRGRLPGVMPALELASVGNLEFRELDSKRFPSVGLAKHALRAGGIKSFLFNLANELAVEAFLKGRIGFTDICSFVEESLIRHDAEAVPTSYADLIETEFYYRTILEEGLVSFHGRLCA